MTRAPAMCDSKLTRVQVNDKVTEWFPTRTRQTAACPWITRRSTMKHERFLADTRRTLGALLAVAFVAGTSAAFAQSMDKKPSTMPGMAAGAEKQGSNMHGSMMGMVKGMESTKMTGDPDQDFAAMMRVHHQGAIDMAQMQLKHGKDATMRSMAKGIIEAQQKEIKELDRWLAQRK